MSFICIIGDVGTDYTVLETIMPFSFAIVRINIKVFSLSNLSIKNMEELYKCDYDHCWWWQVSKYLVLVFGKTFTIPLQMNTRYRIWAVRMWCFSCWHWNNFISQQNLMQLNTKVYHGNTSDWFLFYNWRTIFDRVIV